MKISILDAQKTIFEGAVSEVILPACDGEMSLMDDHEPAFIALGKGAIKLKLIAQKVFKLVRIHRGLARMRRNELVILVE